MSKLLLCCKGWGNRVLSTASTEFTKTLLPYSRGKLASFILFCNCAIAVGWILLLSYMTLQVHEVSLGIQSTIGTWTFFLLSLIKQYGDMTFLPKSNSRALKIKMKCFLNRSKSQDSSRTKKKLSFDLFCLNIFSVSKD